MGHCGGMADGAHRVTRLVWATGCAVAFAALPAVVAGAGLPVATGRVSVGAGCPPNELPNPAGYGCIPALAPGGAVVGAPTQQEISACHGGNLYFCIDPYGQQ
jgi:hypothetical protein